MPAWEIEDICLPSFLPPPPFCLFLAFFLFSSHQLCFICGCIRKFGAGLRNKSNAILSVQWMTFTHSLLVQFSIQELIHLAELDKYMVSGSSVPDKRTKRRQRHSGAQTSLYHLLSVWEQCKPTITDGKHRVL